MTEYDPGWKEYIECTALERATHNEDMVTMLREMMDDANENRASAFVIYSQVIEIDDDKALYTPQYEGEIVAIEEGEVEDYLMLQNVTVMQEEDDPDPSQVLKYTTLEQQENVRVAISEIANIMGSSRRLGNDYIT